MTSENLREERKLVEWFANSRTSLARIPRYLSSGSIELVFPSETSRREQSVHCQRSVSQNCLEGSRAACSVNAIKKCRPSWLATIFHRGSYENQISKCEDDYMITCLKRSERDCILHSKSLCEKLFNPDG